MWIFVFTCLFGRLILGQCPISVLEDTGDLMSQLFCGLYTDSALAKINGVYLAEGANVTIRSYDPILQSCGNPKIIPIRVWLPLMFRQDHECSALIAVGSSAGPNGLVTVSGYVDHRLALSEIVRDITMIFTPSPSTACNLLIQQILMSDIRCWPFIDASTGTGGGTGTGSGTGTGTGTDSTETGGTGSDSTGTGGTDSGSSTLSSTSIMTTGKTYVTDPERYNSVTTTGAEFDSDQFRGGGGPNSPFGGPNGKPETCRFNSAQLKLLMGAFPRKYAEIACMRAGLRLAKITQGNLREAITIVGACLGEGQAAWIKSYWRAIPSNTCLEVVAGKTSRSGGINLTASCSKAQAVICEDPFFMV